MPQTDADQSGSSYGAAWAPTHDPARDHVLNPSGVFSSAKAWNAFGLTIFGHSLGVNVLTGGLLVSVTDMSIPYYSIPFGIKRTFDSQEQHVQAKYLRSNPNSDRRYHFFGNWQFQQEAQVSPTWNRVYPELLVSDGDGESVLFNRHYPNFDVNTVSGSAVEEVLRAHGVPGRTMAALKWTYNVYDCLLRTLRGRFAILTGTFREETLVDGVDMRLWRFEPMTGMGYKYTSEFAYQRLIDVDGIVETNVQSILSQTIDALGHTVTFLPVPPLPPYRSYRLADGAGRAFDLDLSEKVVYGDVNSFGGQAKIYVVSKVTDTTSAISRSIGYKYVDGLLTTVLYPGHAGASPREVSYAYSEDGDLIRITNPEGDYISIDYLEDLLDSDEHLIPRLKVSTISDLEGNLARYSYDHPAKKVTVEFAGPGLPSKTVSYSYAEDANDTKQRYTTMEEVNVVSGYSGSQLIQRKWLYSSDGRFLVTQAVDPVGNITAFEYNEFNQLTAFIDATGHPRNFLYDVHASPTSSNPLRFDQIGTTEKNVDLQGPVPAITTSRQFETYNNATSTDPADGAQSTHRTISGTDGNGNVTNYEYDDVGSNYPISPTLIVDALGKKTQRAFDGTGQLIRLTDAVGNVWSGFYNLQGQLINSIDANGFHNHWIFDLGSGWMTAFTDALGSGPGDPHHSVFYEWSSAGLLLRRTDQIGDKSDYSYFRNQRLRSVTQYDPSTRQIAFQYDVNGRLTTITDPLGRKTFFVIDEAGRIFETYRNALGAQSLRCTRDLAGRVTSMKDRNGQVTNYKYDTLSRLIDIQEPNWPADAPVNVGKHITLEYDQLSRLLRITDSQLPTPSTFNYDANGNVLETTDAFGSKLSSTYDARNALVRLSGLAGAVDLRFTRDDTGNIQVVKDSGFIDQSRSFAYLRSDNGLVDNLYQISMDSSGIKTHFRYDGNRNLLEVSHRTSSKTLLDFKYLNRFDGFIQGVSGDHSGSYVYDGLKQLTGETDSSVQIVYDGANNILSRSNLPLSFGNLNQYDTDNRLLNRPSEGNSFSYDNNGNLRVKKVLGGTTTKYVFDGANRLAVLDDGTATTNFTYDILGRLVQRERTSGAASDVQRYLYGARSVLAILSDQNKITTLFTRDPDGRLLRRRSLTQLSATASKDSRSLFYLLDGLGSVCRLVDWDAKVIQEMDYTAWGESTGSTPVGNELFRYRSGHFDAGSRLLKFGYRWYDPNLGRWISQDPVMQLLLLRNIDASNYVSEIINLYAYCNNSPLNISDTTGFFPNPIQWLADKFGDAARVWVLIQNLVNVGPDSMPPKPDPPSVVDKNKPNDNDGSGAGAGPKPDPPTPPSNPGLGPNNNGFVPVLPLPTVPTPTPTPMPVPEPIPIFDFIFASNGSSDAGIIDSSISSDLEAGATGDSADITSGGGEGAGDAGAGDASASAAV